MTNEYGMKIDRTGYAPSIIQSDTGCCWYCGRSDRKLDRHEPFNGAFRTKSKWYGMWIMLCDEECHAAAHSFHAYSAALKKEAQQSAMQTYGWSTEEFIERFGRNWI